MLETLALMGQGFVNALVPVNLLAMAAGTTIGIVIGCLPGLSAAMGVALLLPMTFTMDASTGLIMLGAIYCQGLGTAEEIKKGVEYLQKAGDNKEAKEELLKYKKTLFGKWVRR